MTILDLADEGSAKPRRSGEVCLSHSPFLAQVSDVARELLSQRCANVAFWRPAPLKSAGQLA